jgi:putative protease
MKEERVGVVTHYFLKIGVAAFALEADLRVGDTIHIKGHTSDFTQKVDSIQIEHENVDAARKGDDIGIKVKEHAREHDVVYKVVEG